ncbi:MAG: helix-turn-helix domain-containing protein [Patescibacteria group bacterium]
MTSGLVTIKSAAEILRVSVETLRNWDKAGRLKARRNKNGYRVYNISELENFAQKEGLKRPKRGLRLIL